MKHPATQLGFALAALIATCVAYGIWYGVVVAASAKDASLAAQIAQQSDASARAAAAERSLVALGPQESAIDARFVATSGIVPFLEDLQDSVSAVGALANVGSVSQDTTPYPHLTIAMTITGSFDAVVRALGVIEYGPYDIQMTQASLTSGSQNSGPAVWTASVTFSVGTLAAGVKTSASATPKATVNANASSTADPVVTPAPAASSSTVAPPVSTSSSPRPS